MINMNNYEIWIMDYMDGQLSTHDIDRLRRFVSEHPELHIDLDDLDVPILSPLNTPKITKHDLYQPLSPDQDEIFIAYMEGDLNLDEIKWYNDRLKNDPEFKAKHLLFNQIRLDDDLLPLNKNNFYATGYTEADADDLIQGEMDGSINEFERKWLHEHFSASFIQAKKSQFDKLTLTPDQKVQYPGKNKLKKKPVFVLFLQRAAAVILLAMSVYGIQQRWNPNNVNNAHLPIVQNDLPSKVLPIDNSIHTKAQPSVSGHVNNDADLIVQNVSGTRPKTVSVYKKRPIEHNTRISESMASNTSTQVKTDASPDEPFFYMKKVEPPVILATIDPQMPVSASADIDGRMIDLNMPALRINRKLPPEHNGYGGEIEIDIPPVMMAMANMVGHASQAYENGLKNNRTVFDFRLGPISFYKSSNND